ncbi:hypothetical protein L6452_27062 [Arctium lappa]|uniref:Uncharacterized protein n=1 Tax=Arctium lappa TaxID=4217 RepID=A0ACB8ZX36_ARCLA|nr:hypothetical protein L6452_27062 [Arctium lappa]
MLEGPKFTGMIGLNNDHDNFLDVTQRLYHKLDDDMSIESFSSLHMSNGGGSLARSLVNSSVGSNGSATFMLSDPGLNHVPINYTAERSVIRGTASNGLTDDGLAQALLDSCFPTKGLKNGQLS